jgi:hypothetical protein
MRTSRLQYMVAAANGLAWAEKQTGDKACHDQEAWTSREGEKSHGDRD